jgi:hypothetical protein
MGAFLIEACVCVCVCVCVCLFSFTEIGEVGWRFGDELFGSQENTQIQNHSFNKPVH